MLEVAIIFLLKATLVFTKIFT